MISKYNPVTEEGKPDDPPMPFPGREADRPEPPPRRPPPRRGKSPPPEARKPRPVPRPRPPRAAEADRREPDRAAPPGERREPPRIAPAKPSCVNWDDSGSPKSAVYGGVRRLRVSSQSWKRATRLYFNDLLDAKDVGVRTKQVVRLRSSFVT